MAETIADKSYVNTSVDVINQRILGRYQNGLGKTWDDPNYMKFFNDGAVNFPYLSDGMWFLTQHKRWGLLKAESTTWPWRPQINQIDLYKDAAGMAKVSVPKDSMRSTKLMDGVVWDGKNPQAYADFFSRSTRLTRNRNERSREQVESLGNAPAPDKRRRSERLASQRRAPAVAGCRTCLRTRVASSVVAAAARHRLPGAGLADRVGQQQPAFPTPLVTWHEAIKTVLRPVLQQEPERPGHRLEHAGVPAAGGASASAWRRWSAFRSAS